MSNLEKLIKECRKLWKNMPLTRKQKDDMIESLGKGYIDEYMSRNGMIPPEIIQKVTQELMQ